MKSPLFDFSIEFDQLGWQVSLFVWAIGLVALWLVPLLLVFASDEKTDFRQPTDRILWFVLVFFLPPIGGILWYAKILLHQITDGGSFVPKFPESGTYEPNDLKRADR
ncbi:MAG: hypothetical protein AAGC44_15365 [Planctomycetota bacterium]